MARKKKTTRRKRLTPAQLADYHKMRGEGLDAQGALRYAKRERLPLDWDDTGPFSPGVVATLTRGAWEIKVKVETDHDADYSYLGEFTDKLKADAIARFGPDDYCGRGFSSREYRYFVPANPAREQVPAIRSSGIARGPAWEEARKNEREDMERAVNYQSGTIVVEAWRAGHKLGTDALGGMDLASETRDSLESVILEHGMIENAIEEGEKERETLCRALCRGRKA